MSNFIFSIVFLFGLVTYGSCGTYECKKKSMDLAILADISRSMNAEDLKQLRAIIHRVVDQLGVSETGNHLAVVTFGGNATIINDFADKNYYNASHMQSSVTKALQYKSKHDGTRTDMAQHLAATKLFTAKGGDRPGVRNIMLLFTDGKFYINTTWDKRPNITLLKTTRELEKKDVTIFVVGVGHDISQPKLEEAAGRNGNVTKHKNFDDLSKKLGALVTKICRRKIN